MKNRLRFALGGHLLEIVAEPVSDDLRYTGYCDGKRILAGVSDEIVARLLIETVRAIEISMVPRKY